MAKILKSIAKIAILAGMALHGGPLGIIGRTLLINGALSLAARALGGKRQGAGASTTQSVMVRSPVAPREIVYGLVRKAGVIVFAKTAGTSNEHLDYVIALAGHQVDAITDIWFDDVMIADADINATTGVISGSTKFAGKALIFKYLGTSTQSVSSLLHTDYGEWLTTAQLKGVAYLHVRFNADTSVYQNGPPQNVFAMVKGKRVYDPRLDSTNGGSGSHRYTDATTWAWSNNPALCAADYITGGAMTFDVATPSANLGFGARPEQIDWPTVISAANECDETMMAVLSEVQTRYLCDGVLSTGNALADNLEDILSSMVGQVVRSNGMYRVFAGAYETPTIALTETDVVGRLQVTTRSPRSELYNAVKGTYFSSSVWQSTEFRARESSTFQTADNGIQLWRDIDLPMTVNGYRAQRIANLILQQSRNQIVVVGDFALTAFQVGLWETLTLTIAELSWSAKVFRCVGWEFNPEGTIRLTLREESAAAYTDLTGSADAFGDYLADFSTSSDPGTPASDVYTPAVVSTSTSGGIPVGTTTGTTTLAVGTDGKLLMTNSTLAQKMEWGPASPAAGDLFTIGATSGRIERLAVGSDGQILTVDTTLDKKLKWATPTGSGGVSNTTVDHDLVTERFTDCDFSISPSLTTQDGFDVTGSQISTAAADAHPGHIGVALLTVNTATSGVIRTNAAAHSFGLGSISFRALIKTPSAVSDATNNYILIIGYVIAADTSATIPRAGFRYNHAENSGKWRYCTNDGTTSPSDSGVTLAASTWYKFEIIANAAGTSVDFKINGTTVGTKTTNIPVYTLGANGRLFFQAAIFKSAATADRTMAVDYIGQRLDFSSAR